MVRPRKPATAGRACLGAGLASLLLRRVHAPIARGVQGRRSAAACQREKRKNINGLQDRYRVRLGRLLPAASGTGWRSGNATVPLCCDWHRGSGPIVEFARLSARSGAQ